MKKRILGAISAMLLLVSVAGCSSEGTGSQVGSTVPGTSVSDSSGAGGFDFPGGMAPDGSGSGTVSQGADDPGDQNDASREDGKDDNPGGKTETASNASESSDSGTNKPVRMVFGSIWADQYTNTSINSALTQLYKTKIAQIKQKYNVTLVVEQITTESIDRISRAISAGDKTYDFIELDQVSIRTMALKGLLLPQNEISTIDFNAEQFSTSKAHRDGVTFKGKVYGSLFGSQISSFLGLFVNQTLLDRYLTGADKVNVMELYKNNEWTFDKFRDICTKLTRTVGGQKIYGVSNASPLSGIMLTANTGGTVTRDSNGKYTPAMLSQNGVEAYNFLRGMIWDDGSVMPDFAQGIDEFKNGQVGFLPHYLSMYNDIITNTNAEVYFVPAPMGPAQKEYIMGVHDSQLIAIPKTVADKELAGKVYQELSTMDKDGMYRNDLARAGMSEEAIDVAMSLYKHLRPEFVGGVDVNGFNSVLDNSLKSASGNPATAFDSVRSQFQKAIDDYYGDAG